jgi:hypothetical protein
MNKISFEKAQRMYPRRSILGIAIILFLMMVCLTATANNAAAAKNNLKEYIPSYGNCAVVDIKNSVGSDIIVSWTKTGSQKAVFQVKVPKGSTRTISIPAGSFDQYIHAGSYWYKVITGRVVVKCGYRYTLKYYMVIKVINGKNPTIVYNGNGFKRIPDSKAPLF